MLNSPRKPAQSSRRAALLGPRLKATRLTATMFSGLFLVACAVATFFFFRNTGESLTMPTGLEPIDWPQDNPYSKSKAELGKLLFFDTRLSPDSTVACASCHSPQHAFAETTSVSTGFHGQQGLRNAPALINAAFSMDFFWDGRAGTLEEQIKGPVSNPIEMAGSPSAVAGHIQAIPGYRGYFQNAFGTPEINWTRITRSIATFERTLVSGNSPYDRYQAGDKSALNEAQVRGSHVFRDARCTVCHAAPYFTSGTFANLGVGSNKPHPDTGRFAVTRDNHDWGTFKTPTLRDIALTAPYMHDGSVRTLEEVVDLYDRGGIPNRNLDNRIRPLHLNVEQKQDLVAFLHALSGQGAQVTPPESFPQ
jgi:cytochrome c peroxidase